MPYKDPIRQKRAQRESHERLTDERRLRQKAKRKTLADRVIELKRDRPCADCGGVFHHAAMHFDHLPGFEKIASIREIINRYQSWPMVEAEIAKCELVCANCHAVRTFEREAWLQTSDTRP